MKTSTNIKRVLLALVLVAYSAVFLSGCIVDRDHGGHDARWDNHDHDHDHDWHDDHHDDHH